MLSALIAAAALEQSALDGFDPKLEPQVSRNEAARERPREDGSRFRAVWNSYDPTTFSQTEKIAHDKKARL